MANDTGETASAFHVATENNTVCFKMVRSLQRTQKSGEKQGRLHERWSWNWTHSRSTVLEAYLEIFWKCMRGISLIASVLSLQCNLEAQLHVGALNYYTVYKGKNKAPLNGISFEVWNTYLSFRNIPNPRFLNKSVIFQTTQKQNNLELNSLANQQKVNQP